MKRRSRANDNEEDLAGRGACYKRDMYCQGKWGQKGARERAWDGRGVTCKGRQNVNNKPKQQRDEDGTTLLLLFFINVFLLISFFGFSFPPTFASSQPYPRTASSLLLFLFIQHICKY